MLIWQMFEKKLPLYEGVEQGKHANCRGSDGVFRTPYETARRIDRRALRVLITLGQ